MIKRLLAIVAGALTVTALAASAGTAFADPPPHSNAGGNSENSPGHGNVNSGPPDQGQQQSNGCHGANEVDCRADPQPTHGRDCMHSDDHACVAAVVEPPPDGGNPNPPGGGTTNPPGGGTTVPPPVVGGVSVPAPSTNAPTIGPSGSVTSTAEVAPATSNVAPIANVPGPVVAPQQLRSETLGVVSAASPQFQPPRTGEAGLVDEGNGSTLLFGALVALGAALLAGSTVLRRDA
jgi:hypothetical protein